MNVSNLQIWKEEALNEDEYLFKFITKGTTTIGFLSKLNKDGSIPSNFLNWPRYGKEKDDIYKFVETYRSGWMWNGCRFGTSQIWAIMLHPLGFTVEITYENLFEICKTTTMVNRIFDCELKYVREGNNKSGFLVLKNN